MTEPQPHLPPADEAGLAALADGGADPELQARVARDPALAAALERQRAALGLLAEAATPAPPVLRARLAALAAAAEDRPRGRRRRLARRRRHARRLLPGAGLAAAAVGAALALLPGGGPVVGDVMAAGLRPPTAAAQAATPVDGVAFPRYDRWRATGTRTDVIGGRTARTVFYARGSARIAYIIVAGPALEASPRLHALPAPPGRAAVTWTRRGRTCLIVASGLDRAAVAQLAVW